MAPKSNHDSFARHRSLAPWYYARPKEEIRYAIAESSLGLILVASSAKGVLSILIGKNRDQLVAELQHRFPKAQLVVGGNTAEIRVARVVRFVEKPAGRLHLPLDIRGTEFQKRVWNVVQSIPRGQVITYADVVRKIGTPNAVRAVGNACSKNKIAIAIPCHRVVRSSGARSEKCPWGVGQRGVLIERELSAGARRSLKPGSAMMSPLSPLP